MRIIFCASQINGWHYFKDVYPALAKEHEVSWLVGGACLEHFRKHRPFAYFEANDTGPRIETSLDEISPELLVLGMGPILEPKTIQWAKIHGVPTVAGLDIGSNIREKLFIDDRPNFPDLVMAIDGYYKDRLMKLGMDGQAIKLVGQPYLDELRMSGEHDIQGIIFFPTQPIEKYYGKGLGYTTMSVLQDLLKVLKSDPPRWFKTLQVKIHDEDAADEILSLLKASGVDYLIENRVEWQKVSLVVGMFSTMLYESFYNRIPTLSYQPVRLEGKIDLADQGGIPLVSTVAELASTMSKHPGNDYRVMNYVPDGMSVERVIKEISSFIRGKDFKLPP